MFQSRNTAQSSDVYKPSISCIDFQLKPCGKEIAILFMKMRR